MIVELENKSVSIPDKDIEKLMTALSISKADAIECWLEDNDEIELDEESQALQNKAQKVKISRGVDYKKDGKPKKVRTYVASDTKKELFGLIWDTVSAKYGENASIKTQDKLIFLEIDGKTFDINLVEHKKATK